MHKQEYVSGVPEVRLDLKRFICVCDKCWLKDALSAFSTRANSKLNLSDVSLSHIHATQASFSLCILKFMMESSLTLYGKFVFLVCAICVN